MKIYQSRPGTPFSEKFWTKVQKTSTCWLWLGCKNDKGYGQIEKKYAHRISWEISNGPICGGLFVLHKCDVTNCINPDHLFLGTQLDNARDRVSKGRGARGEKVGGCVLKESQARDIKKLLLRNFSASKIASQLKVHISLSMT